MSLNVRAMAVAGWLLWGGAVMATGIADLVKPKYGKNFLELIASIYPGYRGRPRIAQVAVGRSTQLSMVLLLGRFVRGCTTSLSSQTCKIGKRLESRCGKAMDEAELSPGVVAREVKTGALKQELR